MCIERALFMLNRTEEVRRFQVRLFAPTRGVKETWGLPINAQLEIRRFRLLLGQGPGYALVRNALPAAEYKRVRDLVRDFIVRAREPALDAARRQALCVVAGDFKSSAAAAPTAGSGGASSAATRSSDAAVAEAMRTWHRDMPSAGTTVIMCVLLQMFGHCRDGLFDAAWAKLQATAAAASSASASASASAASASASSYSASAAVPTIDFEDMSLDDFTDPSRDVSSLVQRSAKNQEIAAAARIEQCALHLHRARFWYAYALIAFIHVENWKGVAATFEYLSRTWY
jgi:hypothetical protein